MRNKTHDHVRQRAANRCRQEPQTCLDGGYLLHVLEVQRLEALNSVEHAPNGEDTKTDDAEDAVAPEGVGDHSWASKFLLTRDPKDKGGDEDYAKDESGKCFGFFDLFGTL